MVSLEGLKTGYPRVPNSASDLRLCIVIFIVATHECPYVSVATDTIRTRESRFGGLPGGRRRRAGQAGSAVRR